MRDKIAFASLILGILLTANSGMKNSDTQTPKLDSTNQQITQYMKSFISIFEIPATDFSRAVQFYQSILDIKISEMEMPGSQMGLFPTEGQMVAGVIIKGEGYQPSADGVVIYLNGGDNLQPILDKVETNGGNIIVPKTLIDPENGFFAMFMDSEGNRIGLHSPH